MGCRNRHESVLVLGGRRRKTSASAGSALTGMQAGHWIVGDPGVFANIRLERCASSWLPQSDVLNLRVFNFRGKTARGYSVQTRSLSPSVPQWPAGASPASAATSHGHGLSSSPRRHESSRVRGIQRSSSCCSAKESSRTGEYGNCSSRRILPRVSMQVDRLC